MLAVLQVVVLNVVHLWTPSNNSLFKLRQSERQITTISLSVVVAGRQVYM